MSKKFVQTLSWKGGRITSGYATLILPSDISGGISSGWYASGSITQYALASGVGGGGTGVASGTVAGYFGSTRDILSGTVGVWDFGSGAVIAGTIGSGAIVSGNIASGQIGVNHCASGVLNNSGLILSGQIGSGQVGVLASGCVSSYNLQSGTTATWALQSMMSVSGVSQYINAPLTTTEIISGGRAVCISPSGNLQIAMASVSGRMPAIGLVWDSCASGTVCNVMVAGAMPFETPIGTGFPYSGLVGRTLYVGRSGQITPYSGSFNSGGFKSGDLLQSIGVVVNSGTGAFNVNSIPNITIPYNAPTGVTQGYIDGLVTSYSTTTSFAVAAGTARDDTDVGFLNLTSTMTKSTSSWAAGNNNGGLDTGTIASGTWYMVFVIGKGNQDSVDVLFSTSTSPTMPTGYTLKRRIGAVLTDGSSHFTKWYQVGDEFWWDVPVRDVNASNPGIAAVTRTLSTPNLIVCKAMMWVGSSATASADDSAAIYISSLNVADTAASVSCASFYSFDSANITYQGGAQVVCWTNTSSQVRSRLQISGVSTALYIVTLGWVDQRGKNGGG